MNLLFRSGVMSLVFLAALGGGSVRAQSEISTATNTPAIRFEAVHLFVEAQAQPLAAYQLEFAVTNGTAKIVGIEGGEHPAFAEPPFYDPQAMQHERVIIAAFSTNAVSHLPQGKTRVATIHLQVSGPLNSGPIPARDIEVKLDVAADADGNKIKAQVSAESATTK